MKHAVRHIHFVGIGGSGMSGIAEVLCNLGYTISGSDLSDSATLRRLAGLGIATFVGHDKAHIVGADAVVTSTAVQASNPEVLRARDLQAEHRQHRRDIARQPMPIPRQQQDHAEHEHVGQVGVKATGLDDAEPPRGSEDRAVLPLAPTGEGGLYLQMNRGKRSVAIDLATPEGAAMVRQLARDIRPEQVEELRAHLRAEASAVQRTDVSGTSGCSW